MKINTHAGSVDIKIDTKRIDRNLKEAQKLLNMAVKNDCEPLVPHLNGALRNSAEFPGGIYGGILQYGGQFAPYAHYQYAGELYLAENGSSWARKYEKKFPAGKPLQYHEPGTTDRWFEKAKEKHKEEWIDLVKREVGKG